MESNVTSQQFVPDKVKKTKNSIRTYKWDYAQRKYVEKDVKILVPMTKKVRIGFCEAEFYKFDIKSDDYYLVYRERVDRNGNVSRTMRPVKYD